MTYKPFEFFAYPGIIAFGLGILLVLRFIYLHLMAVGGGHIQSLLAAALLIGLGAFLFVVGLIADLISVNRKLLEKLDWKVQKLEEKLKNDNR